MKTVKLKKLTIKDWRGQNKEVDFSDINEVRGRNESGKSTLFNAFLWLLTGSDELDRTNYELYNNKLPQTKENSKLGIVEAVIDIDGSEFTMKKTYEMGWTRVRGSSEYTRKGTDNYHFYIDEIERPATAYKQFVEETFAPIDKLKIMLNIRHFIGSDWKGQRKHLEAFIGKFDATKMKGDYAEIMDDLEKYGTDDLKIHYRSLLKKAKDSAEELPSVIETLKNVLKEMPSESEIEEAEQNIKDTQEQIASIDRQINGSTEHIQPYIEKRDAELSEIENLRAEFQKAKSEYNLKQIEAEMEIKKEISEIDMYNSKVQRENEEAEREVNHAKEQIENEKRRLSQMIEYRDSLRQKNIELKNMHFTNDKCPMCGQTLPEDKLEESKQKFFKERDAERNVVISKGKKANEDIAECEKRIKFFQDKIDAGFEKKPLKDKERIEAKLADLRRSHVSYEETTEGKEKARQISEKEANLTQIPQVDNTALLNMKQELLNDIVSFGEIKGKGKDVERYKKDISTKEHELKEAACEQARLEGLLDKLTKYEREKAEMLSEDVNKHFNVVKVQMYDYDKSGNMFDTCRITINGVSVNVTNNASRLLAGIDISTAFGKFFGVNMPLFVDNCEGIDEDKFPEIPNQVIKNIRCNEDFNIIKK